jgi:hypothetical protein
VCESQARSELHRGEDSLSLVWEDIQWETQKGKLLRIPDMHTSHLRNAIACADRYERKARNAGDSDPWRWRREEIIALRVELERRAC